MLRLTRYLVIGVFTCALGISAGALWNRLNAPISCNGVETGWIPANEPVKEEKIEDLFRNSYPPGVQPPVVYHGREEMVSSKDRKKKERSSKSRNQVIQ